MTELLAKEELLRSAGYRYSFDRELYLNRDLRKAFSVSFVEDHSAEDIQQALQQPARERWSFFFNDSPSAAVERELENVLG